jgi:hypothetical protein
MSAAWTVDNHVSGTHGELEVLDTHRALSRNDDVDFLVIHIVRMNSNIGPGWNDRKIDKVGAEIRCLQDTFRQDEIAAMVSDFFRKKGVFKRKMLFSIHNAGISFSKLAYHNVCKKDRPLSACRREADWQQFYSI